MGPLKGLKIIEMSAIGPVPLAGMLLADMGADVLVIDKPNDPYLIPGDVLRRGKRTVSLDLKSEEDKTSLLRLINQADVLIEGFRPGVMERLRLGPDECCSANSELIFARMTGWGQTGPLAQAAGHDINYIALSGALNAIGRGSDCPPPPLNLVGDYGGGSLFLVMGVLAALHERQSSGKGQVIDAAITEGTANLMSLFYSLNNVGAWSAKRASNLLDSAAHFYDTYQTKDGGFVSLGAIEPKFYALMTQALELRKEDFDQQYDVSRWPELKRKIALVMATKTRDQWCELLEGKDVCFAPVLDYLEAPRHSHMQAREAYMEIDGKVQPAPAPKFSRTPSKVSSNSEAVSMQVMLNDWLVKTM